MKALPNRIYAHVVGGRVRALVTEKTLPEWNERDLDVRDITDLQPQPAPGWFVEGDAWSAEPLARGDRLAKIEAAIPAQLAAPIVYKGNTFRADDQARAALLHAAVYVLGGREIPAGWYWPDVDGKPVAFTREDVLELHAALLERNWQIHMGAAEARDAVATIKGG